MPIREDDIEIVTLKESGNVKISINEQIKKLAEQAWEKADVENFSTKKFYPELVMDEGNNQITFSIYQNVSVLSEHTAD